MNYTAKQIADITESEVIGNPNISIKNIVFDSRNIYSVADTAFLAIKTEKNNGEKYIKNAVEKGISVIISESLITDLKEVTQIVTPHTIKFLQKLAKYHISQFGLKTIGITGSNGKTVLKEWLYQSLSEDFSTVKSPKSFNSQIGLPLSLLQTEVFHEVGIFEAGISQPGEMEVLAGIFSPKIGVFTHLGTAHLANFSSDEELLSEKLRLFKNSEIIIFNGDNHLVFKTITEKFKSKKLISFGLTHLNDVKILSDWKDYSKPVKVSWFGEEFSIPVVHRDEATLSNMLALVAVLREFGFSFEKISEKINRLRAVEMRLESINGVRNNLLINDSFNFDLDSLIIAYQFINEYNRPKKSVVLTDMHSGNSDKETLYKTIAELTNSQNFSKIFLVGEEISSFKHFFKAETLTFATTKELIDNQEFNSIENELILLKGARVFEIEKVKEHLELQKHDTVLEVNLNAIIHNINIHKALLKPETKMMAMVKAYSYGLGGYEIAEFLQHHHIDYLGVAYADEGAELRKNGITVPIMVMNPEQHSYSSIIDYNLEPEIYSFRVLELFHEEVLRKGISYKYPIHIKLETGMHRLGFKTDELDEMIEKLGKMQLSVKSTFSHLSSADDDSEREYTLHQLETFRKNSEKLKNALPERPLRHILNSAGITNYSDYQFDMVRIGIGMMGISPNENIEKKLQNAVSLKTVISQISELESGDSVGYNRRFKTERPSKIATIPVGYADGIPRLVGNKNGMVGIRGKKFPIVGNVCMDMLMVDITGENINEGEQVLIFNGNPTLKEFSEYCKTIPYEVLTSVSRRVKRIYIKN